jgi:hypothetical protein
MIRLIEIPEESLDACDTSNIERVLRDVEKTPESVRSLRGWLMLSFDVVAPVVCLEPRVKAFLRAVHERIPHLWYYLVPDPAYGNLNMFFAVFGSPGTVRLQGDSLQTQPGRDEIALLLDRLGHATRFATRMADDPRSMLDALLAPMPPKTRKILIEGAIELGAGEPTSLAAFPCAYQRSLPGGRAA